MSKIEWTDETWNPVVGCSHVSDGCHNCWAERMAFRQAHMELAVLEKILQNQPTKKRKGKYALVVDLRKKGWTGEIYYDESFLDKPLHWHKPRKIFVCSMGDLFHKSVPFEFIDKVMAVVALCPQHTFQLLTKRPKIMAEYFGPFDIRNLTPKGKHWPYSNVWLGVTAENQEQADKRIPILLQTPAAKRFVSIEPMLGAINLEEIIEIRQFQGDGKGWPTQKRPVKINALYGYGIESPEDDENGKPIYYSAPTETVPKIDQIIIGCESGPGRRECKIEWMIDLVEQCKSAGIAVFVKQVSINGKVSKIMAEWPKELQLQEFPK